MKSHRTTKNQNADLEKAGVITISDSKFKLKKRNRDEDKSGPIIQEKLENLGFRTVREIIPDDENMIEGKIRELLSKGNIDIIITTGGTGITEKDVTYETVKPILNKILPGFGEALRRRGYERVGGLGILSRAIAGIYNQTPIFCLPGPPNSVKIGMDLIDDKLREIVKMSKSN